jgi:hypothetical protein
VVVSGGPGSGKCVIALSLLGELARQGRAALHATGSKSFTQTLRRYAGKGSARLKNLFLYFNSFMTAERNGIDVLICDEAHRIRETSVNRFTRASQRQGARAQLEELIAAARVPVFLLDEHQVVKPGELGNVEIITAYARKLNIEVDVVSLHDQFRCGGSEAYEQWVLSLLGLNGDKPIVWGGRWPLRAPCRRNSSGDGSFPCRQAGRRGDRPDDCRLLLALERSTPRRHARARCADRRLVTSLERQERPQRRRRAGQPVLGDRPERLRPNRLRLHRAGLRVRVVWRHHRPDLVVRDGRLVTDRDEFKDPNFRSRKTVSDEEADRLIRNTYKVLMTRGMRGTILYATDPTTRRFLADLVRVRRGLETVYE